MTNYLMFDERDEALGAIPPYVPTAADMKEIEAAGRSLDFWKSKSGWSGDDGFSLTEFCAPSAAADANTRMDYVLNGRLAVFVVLTVAETGEILPARREPLPAYGRPWANEWKWVVRENGRMVRDASGAWATYPINPARTSTHAKRGVKERWIAAPARLVDAGKTLGETLKSGVMHPSLKLVPVIETADA